MLKPKRRIARIFLNLAAFTILCAVAGVWAIGGYLCAPFPKFIALPSDLPVNAVTIPSKSGAVLRGWLITGNANHGVVILMHGVRGCRLDMMDRARFLANAGYTVLLFDFQAHGESVGRHITFGYLESRDATAVVEFVKERFPSKPIGVIGGSLGGASALLASPPMEVQAMVLESVYPTIKDAVEDRLELKFGWPGRWLAPLLTWQLSPRLGCSVDDLCPIRKAENNRIPKLFIAGTADRHTKIEESKEMFRRAAEPKELWEVEGVAHIDIHHFRRELYERRVLIFLARYLHED